LEGLRPRIDSVVPSEFASLDEYRDAIGVVVGLA
jgi:hypothetical protein